MAEISKPSDINKIWSSAGDVISPSDTKIANGWAVEIPPRQWFNWLDNKQDQAIAHINQHGIPVWDSVTEYRAGKSIVQGSNGAFYRSVTTNTNINPVTDLGGNWFQVAMLPKATTSQAQALTDDLSLITPNLLNLAFQGANQSNSANGYQRFPGGVIIQWGTNTTSGQSVTVPLPITYTAGHLAAVVTRTSTTVASDMNTFATDALSLTDFIVRSQQTNVTFRWISIGR